MVGDAIDSGAATIGIKADLLPMDTPFETWGRREIGLDISALDAIKVVASRGSVLVVIDQLDALASTVDLTSDRLNDVIEFIDRCSSIPQVSVICSCRRFDYSRDTRFTSLDAKVIELELPSWVDVAAQLARHGIENAENWPESFRELLRTPQHLRVYLERFRQTGQEDVFGSYQMMLDDLWDRKLQTNEQRALAYQIAEYSIGTESLWIPDVLIESKRSLVAQLESEQILCRQDRHVGFLHQTLLEHAKARLFTKTEQSLCDHVLERQDAILVRPTLWAVLRYLRDANRPKYHNELSRLMNASLRLHVRFLLIDFLGQVPEPDEQETLHMAERLAHDPDRLRVLIAIRGKEGWFRALRWSQFPTVMKWGTQDRWAMVGVISDAWQFAREECLRLILDYWIDDPSKDELTWRALREIGRWDQQTVGLVCRIVRRAKGEGDQLWWAEDLVYTISADQPRLAPQVFLEVVSRSDAEECGDLSPASRSQATAKSRRTPLESTNTWHELPAVAEAAPIEFLQVVWGWFVENAEQFHDGYESSVVYEYAGSLRALDREEGDLGCSVTMAVCISVEETAKIDEQAFLNITRSAWTCEVRPVQRLLARGLTVAAAKIPEVVMDFFREDRRRFTLGSYVGELQGDSTALVKAVAPHLDENARKTLENMILSWSQYREDVGVDERRDVYDREARLRLLKAIPSHLLSTETDQLVEREERELPDWDRKRPGVRSGFVREVPPLSKAEMRTASDEAILQSLDGPQRRDRSASEWNEVEGGWEEPGGAWAATRELVELAKEDRDRVLSLLPRLIEDGNELPVAEVIRELVESDFSPDESYELIRRLAVLSPKSEEFRSTAGYLLYKRCQSDLGLPDDLCQLLERWLVMPWESDDGLAESDDLEGSDEEREPSSVLWHGLGGAIHTDRSFWPLLAVTNGFLMRSPPETRRWLRLLDDLLDSGISSDTWTRYCSELRWISLKGCDREYGCRMIAKLFDGHPSIKYRPQGVRLVAMVSHYLTEDFVSHFLDHLLASERFGHRQAYGELLTLLALRRDKHQWAAKRLQGQLEELAAGVGRGEPIAVGVAFAASRLWDEPEARLEACRVLRHLIPQATVKVSAAIGTVFWSAEDFPADEHTDALLKKIVENPTAMSGRFIPDLVEHLADLLPHSRETVLHVCQAILERRGDELTSFSHELYQSGPSLVNIAMTLQRFDDTRSEGLSLLEELLRLGLDDAFTILHDIDMRPESMIRREPRRRRRRRRRRRDD